MNRCRALSLLLLFAAGALCAASAQITDQKHGTVIGDVVMYVTPDEHAARSRVPAAGAIHG